MVKLSDTQLVILSAASQRDGRLVLPLPDRIKGGAAAKVVDSLLAKGLIEEVEAKRANPVWRETGDGHRVTLVVTDAGLAAIGIEPGDANAAPTGATNAPSVETASDTTAKTEATPKTPTPRQGTKQAMLVAMLRASEGATIEEIMAATGWQSHTVRGTFAGALKKKLGLVVTSDKIEGRGRVYRIEV
jgi:hypothetical protein